MTFGQLLNHHLGRQQRSASWLAERLGIYPSTVTRWLNEESRPRDPNQVIRIADVLGVYRPDERRALLIAAGFAYVESPSTTPPSTDPATEEPDPSLAEITPAVEPPPTQELPTLPDLPAVTTIPAWLRDRLGWHQAPDEARTSWAGMTIYSLRRLVNEQMIRHVQNLLISLALWLATSWLLTPILSWPLTDLNERKWATAGFAVANLTIPPFVALSTQPDRFVLFVPQTWRGWALLWFLKLVGAYVGFGGFAGLAVALSLLWRQLTASGFSPVLSGVLAVAPLLFSHIGARRIPYDRYRLYGELRAHPADRLFLPIFVGFGPLIALFVFVAYPLLTNRLVGFATLVSLIALIWWEQRSTR